MKNSIPSGYNSDRQILAMKKFWPQFKAIKRDCYDIEFIGTLRAKPTHPVYTISIHYRGGLPPHVRILRPELVEDAPHFYKKSKTLCLYHFKNYRWIAHQ